MKRIFLHILIAIFLLYGCENSRKKDALKIETRLSENSPCYGGNLKLCLSELTGIEQNLSSLLLKNRLISSLIFGSLLENDQDGSLKCALSEFYEISPDGKKLSFRIFSPLFLHSKKTYTAEDAASVITGFSRLNDSDYRELSGKIRNVTVNGDTVEIAWEPSHPDDIYLWTLPLIPENVFTDVTDEMRPDGCGPYRYSSWIKGESITLSSNDEYCRNRPFIEKLSFVRYPSESAAFIDLTSGKLDLLKLNYDQLAKQTASELFLGRFGIYSVPEEKNIICLYLNPDGDLSEHKVRKALIKSLDLHFISGYLFHGMPVRYSGAFPDGFFASSGDKEIFMDTKEAAELFSSCGYERNSADGFLEKNGKMLKFSILLTKPAGWQGPFITSDSDRWECPFSEESVNGYLAGYLAGYWKDTGVSTEIVICSENDLSQRFKNGDFQIMLYTRAAEGDMLFPPFRAGGTEVLEQEFFQKSPLYSEKVAEIFHEAEQNYSFLKRRTMLKEADRLLSENYIRQVICSVPQFYAVNRRVRGIENRAYNFFDIRKWFVPRALWDRPANLRNSR